MEFAEHVDDDEDGVCEVDGFAKFILDGEGHDVAGADVVIGVEHEHRPTNILTVLDEGVQAFAPACFGSVEVEVEDRALAGGLAEEGFAPRHSISEVQGEVGLTREGFPKEHREHPHRQEAGDDPL